MPSNPPARIEALLLYTGASLRNSSNGNLGGHSVSISGKALRLVLKNRMIRPTLRFFAMPRIHLQWISVVLMVACAHATSSSESVLERGGELANIRVERAVVEVTARSITVWGTSEVPDGSRMQMAFAGVDAITRSELLKVLQVRILSLVTDVESTDPARRSITDETFEVVNGVLAHAGSMPHGWARVRRGNETLIRIWARLEVPRATLETAVRSLLERRGKNTSSPILDGLTLPDTNTNP
jgi:hypothetical protein